MDLFWLVHAGTRLVPTERGWSFRSIYLDRFMYFHLPNYGKNWKRTYCAMEWGQHRPLPGNRKLLLSKLLEQTFEFSFSFTQILKTNHRLIFLLTLGIHDDWTMICEWSVNVDFSLYSTDCEIPFLIRPVVHYANNAIEIIVILYDLN